MAKRQSISGAQLPTGTQRRPFVAPGVTPEAAYKAGLDARQAARRAGQGGLPKTNVPVAGGPTPAIPALNQPHQEGMTMQEQAEAARVSHVADGLTPNQGGIVDGLPASSGTAPSPAQLGLLPTDLLTEEATRDPTFQQGHGSMVAVYQPHLAMKYGVMRGGKHIMPQQLQPQRPQLRPETVKDLETLNKLKEQAQADVPVGSLHSSEEEAAKALEGTSAAAAARAGNVIGDDSERPITAEERKKLREGISKMDEFDLDSFRQAMLKDILNNPEQQKLIESKLKPLSIDELLMKNRVTQDVSIRTGIVFTFQSMTGEEDLAVKRLIMDEAKSVEVSDRYFLDKYSFMSVTVGLRAINGKPMGEHVDEKGNFDDEKFDAKFNRILKLPLHMLASIGVNLFWFEARVRKLFVAEKVGNG